MKTKKTYSSPTVDCRIFEDNDVLTTSGEETMVDFSNNTGNWRPDTNIWGETNNG